jgi:hypothetical protein
MTWLNPWLLLGALGIGLPILAHLLNRFQVKHTDWAAMQFLNRSVRVRSRQLRLRDLLLLLLRCLAVLLIVAAIARPAWRGTDGSWLPGEERAGVVIALDASFSMAHGEENATRFDQAMERLQVIVERVGSGNPVSVAMIGGEHRVVIRNMMFDRTRFDEIMGEQKPAAETMDLASVPKLLMKLADDLEAHDKEIYFITDAQADDWRRLPSPARQAWKELDQAAHVFVAPVPGEPTNLAVTELKLVSGVLRKGTIARYQATVHNFGPRPAQNVQVHCQIDDVQIDTKTIPVIAADASQTVSFFVPFYNAGPTRITAEIRADSLDDDNIRRIVAVVQDRLSVLCVDGSGGSAGTLIESALLARADASNGEDYLVRTVPWFSFTQQMLDGVNVVVIANVPQITEGQAKWLSRYIREGGGLIWFAGDKVNASEWNKYASPGADPILPAAIGQTVISRDALGAGKPLDPAMPEHPVCLPLRSLPEDLLSETLFLKRLSVTPAAASFQLLQLAGTKEPILLERAAGRGQVFMFTTSAETTWNNMARTPVFPMLMQQIVTYLAGREYEQPRIVGDSLSLSYAAQPDASNAMFETPSGQTMAEPVRVFRDQFMAMLDRADEAGFYTARVSVQAPGMPIAVNVDTRESDVACLTPAQLRAALDDSGIEVAGSDTELASAIELSRTGRSSWRFFMFAALAILLIECLLADRLMSRRSAAAPTPMGGP